MLYVYYQASNVKDELQLSRPKRVKLSEFSQSLFETEAKVGNEDSDGSSAKMGSESSDSNEADEADEPDGSEADKADYVDSDGFDATSFDKADGAFFGNY